MEKKSLSCVWPRSSPGNWSPPSVDTHGLMPPVPQATTTNATMQMIMFSTPPSSFSSSPEKFIAETAVVLVDRHAFYMTRPCLHKVVSFYINQVHDHQKHANDVDYWQNENCFKLSPVWIGYYCANKWCEVAHRHISMINLSWNILWRDVILKWMFKRERKQREGIKSSAFWEANKLIQVQHQYGTHSIVSVTFAELVANDETHPPRIIVAAAILVVYLFIHNLTMVGITCHCCDMSRIQSHHRSLNVFDSSLVIAIRIWICIRWIFSVHAQ